MGADDAGMTRDEEQQAFVDALRRVAATGEPVQALASDSDTWVSKLHVDLLRIARWLLEPVLDEGQPTPQVLLMDCVEIQWVVNGESLVFWVDPNWDLDRVEWSVAIYTERARHLMWLAEAPVDDGPISPATVDEMRGWLANAGKDVTHPVKNWLTQYWDAVAQEERHE